MSRRKRELSGEEKRLWQRVAETVKPKRKAARPAAGAAAPEPAPAPKTPARASAKRAAPAPSRPSAPAGPLHNRGGEKRVRRGKLEIGATLDLHGHTQASGRAALARFVQSAHARGERTIIVITGVGRAGQGVLKKLLPEWLAEAELRALVSGYAQAHRGHGGAGAYYVFLKAPRD